MKKTYLAPATTTITLAPHAQVLASSPGVSLMRSSADKDEEVLSRQGASFWDDEDY